MAKFDFTSNFYIPKLSAAHDSSEIFFVMLRITSSQIRLSVKLEGRLHHWDAIFNVIYIFV